MHIFESIIMRINIQSGYKFERCGGILDDIHTSERVPAEGEA